MVLEGLYTVRSPQETFCLRVLTKLGSSSYFQLPHFRQAIQEILQLLTLGSALFVLSIIKLVSKI